MLSILNLLSSWTLRFSDWSAQCLPGTRGRRWLQRPLPMTRPPVTPLLTWVASLLSRALALVDLGLLCSHMALLALLGLLALLAHLCLESNRRSRG
jgi:hypothetical protein